ncbi:serine/threonine-protein kinase PknK [candidate division CSSED10-310 bacterium]|uniref:Serine/threonine-protein kinase PknK n=1 Tax=candidate division CSSED10-310 bacterium TaxID=2855610 RepID=A0ABV6Z459_UNCC1
MLNKQHHIASYRIEELLGQGGMGSVYLCQHQESHQFVALKTIRVTDELQIQGIRREIHGLRRINHSGIVRILDEGIYEGCPWYTMELLEGLTLRQCITGIKKHCAKLGAREQSEPGENSEDKTGNLSPAFHSCWTLSLGSLQKTGMRPRELPESDDGKIEIITSIQTNQHYRNIHKRRFPSICSFIFSLCTTLAYLHGEGIVHRDLKPDNIFVKPDGSPVIVDFGLITEFSSAASRETLSVESGTVGTLPYMAPEQIRGDLVDARADLYSLGCIFYELLTGHLPFVGIRTNQIIKAHLYSEPVPPSKFEKALPPEIDNLVLALLAKKPQDRLGYADKIAAVVSQYMSASMIHDTGPRPRAYLYRSQFVGREDLSSTLDGFLNDLTCGSGKLLILQGVSGIGKTRLAMEFGRKVAQQNIRVLTGECLEFGAQPLEAFRKLLQRIADNCRELGKETADRVFGKRGKVLAEYESSIRDLPGQDLYDEPEVLSPDAERFRLFLYLIEVLKSFTENGLLLVIIDDLQWIDDLGGGFLEFLVHGAHLNNSPVLFMGLVRGEERCENIKKIIRMPDVPVLTVDRLADNDVYSIIGNMLALSSPPKQFCRFLSQYTEGNPFFLAEYLRTAVYEGLLWRDQLGFWQIGTTFDESADSETISQGLPLPRSLSELIQKRIHRISKTSRFVARAAAVVGRDVQFLLIWDITALDEATVIDAFEELELFHILEKLVPGTWRFTHDSIRNAVYADIVVNDLPALHQAAASSIENLFRSNRDEYLAELGSHWEKAGQHDKARQYYLLSARRAKKKYTYVEAEKMYRAFLNLTREPTPERITISNELADELFHHLGMNQKAISLYQSAINDAQLLGDRFLEVKCMSLLGKVYLATGALEEAHILSSQVLEMVKEIADYETECANLSTMAGIYRYRGLMAEALRYYNLSLTVAQENCDLKLESSILMGIGLLYFEKSQIQNALTCYHKAQKLAHSIKDRKTEARTLNGLALLYCEQGFMDKSLELYQRAISLAKEIGDRQLEGVAIGNLALFHNRQSQYQEALLFNQKALDIAREVGDRIIEGRTIGNRGTIYQLMGQLDEALKYYDPSLLIARELRDRRTESRNLCNIASIHNIQGAHQKARHIYEQAIGIVREIGDRRVEGSITGSLAELYVIEGALEIADELFKKSLSVLEEVGDQFYRGTLLTAYASMIRRALGDYQDAAHKLNQAQEIMENIKNRYQLAMVLVERGHLELAQGRPADKYIAEVNDLVQQLQVGHESQLSRFMKRLLEAQALFEKGEHNRLFRGECWSSFSSGIKQWLIKNGQLPAQLHSSEKE